jgi:hypothetical protein
LQFFFFFPADIISCVEFNHDGDLLATGDKGGRVVIFQRDPIVSILTLHSIPLKLISSKKENNNLSHPLFNQGSLQEFGGNEVVNKRFQLCGSV